MDLNQPVIRTPPEGQNHDRIQADLGTRGLSSGGNAPNLAAPNLSRATTSDVGVEVMDIRPDQSQGDVDESGRNYSQESGSGEPETGAAGGVPRTPQPDASVMVEIIPTPPPPEGENLVRVTSHGSSIDSSAGIDIAPPPPIGQVIIPGATSRRPELDVIPRRRTINVPPPPPPPPPESPNPADEHDEDLQDDEEDPWWTDLVEDTTAPDEEELKEIEQAGPEISALDRKCTQYHKMYRD